MSTPDDRPTRADVRKLEQLSCAAREIIVRQSKRANVGHIGSALSVVDILVALYGHVLQGSGTAGRDRDRFVLSKGHAALALYAVLALTEVISLDHLESYCGDDSLLGVHPDHALPGVDFSTGSLGQGLSFGAGAALAAKLQASQRRVFVLLSDAELNEGSTWEAVMFAAHHRLSNLIAVLDCNQQQALGFTADVLDLNPIADRWRSFGWTVQETAGNDVAALVSALESPEASRSARPRLIIADTVFGSGVAFMERQIKWHYLPMSDAEYQLAIEQLGKRRDQIAAR